MEGRTVARKLEAHTQWQAARSMNYARALCALNPFVPAHQKGLRVMTGTAVPRTCTATARG